MKKTLFTLALCGLTFMAKSQNASVEESTYGIQAGFLGIWVHNEKKLSNEIALRGEIGFDVGITGSSFLNSEIGGPNYNKTSLFFTPVVTLEPRWYYNLKKRLSKSRKIEGNSGNFVSIKTSYNPDWFLISSNDNIMVINQISIIPTWGVRRNIGNHFTFESGIGLGYRYIFAKSAGYRDNQSEGALNLHLRIGYRF